MFKIHLSEICGSIIIIYVGLIGNEGLIGNKGFDFNELIHDIHIYTYILK